MINTYNVCHLIRLIRFFLIVSLYTLNWFPQVLSAQAVYRTIEEWNQIIQNQMLEQNFRVALASCLKAQSQYPEQNSFREYEASIREYLQVKQQSDNEETITEIYDEEKQLQNIQEENPQSRLTLRDRLVLAAKQDQLLAFYGGIGLHQGNTADGMTLLNPFTQAVMNLYFSPNLGVNLFYYDPHWELPLERTPGGLFRSGLYSLVFGGSFRFRNRINTFSNRSSLTIAIDLGLGLYDLFVMIANYQPEAIIVLGFKISDRPFYHFFGIEPLAGLEVDLSFSLYLNTKREILNIVQTGNIQAILWQSFGIFRLGFTYQLSISEFYEEQQISFIQHQFALLVGLEWRTSFS